MDFSQILEMFGNAMSQSSGGGQTDAGLSGYQDMGGNGLRQPRGIRNPVAGMEPAQQPQPDISRLIALLQSQGMGGVSQGAPGGNYLGNFGGHLFGRQQQ